VEKRQTVRVLACGSIPPAWGGASSGGVATFHRTILDQLQVREDFEIVGLLPFNLDPGGVLRPPAVPVFTCPGREERQWYVDLIAATTPDVVMFQHIAHRWALYHAELSHRPPAVGVVHSWHSITFASPERAAQVRRTVGRAMASCDCLVFVSETCRAEGTALGFSYPAATTVIHNPVGREFLSEMPRTLHDRAGWVYAGSLIERKNPLIALQAAALCRARIAFLGDGPEEMALRTEARRLDVEDLVEFAGRVTPQQIRERLLRAELLCLPSRSEGFSIAYLEALACGTPVVGAAGNVTELEDLLGMPCGAPVADPTPADVAAAARMVQSSSWDRERLRARTLSAFSPDTVGAAYASLLRGYVSDQKG
jgi:glycosyltransferase involved in cell wall biosynthesis